jgi:FSR family fosmidomycin resistance protein-like MFS transporter
MLGGLLGSIILYIRLTDVPRSPAVAGVQPAWGQALRTMGPLLLPLAGITVVRAFMVMALSTYLPVFLSEEGASLWFVGASLTVLQSAGVVGAMLAGPLSDRISRRTLLAASLLAAPLLMLAFLQARGWVQIPLLLVLGFAAISVNPVFMALVQESFPQNRALANGIYMALNFVLSSTVVVILGTLGDRFGLRPTFTVSAFISLIGLPLVFLLPVRRAPALRG